MQKPHIVPAHLRHISREVEPPEVLHAVFQLANLETSANRFKHEYIISFRCSKIGPMTNRGCTGRGNCHLRHKPGYLNLLHPGTGLSMGGISPCASSTAAGTPTREREKKVGGLGDQGKSSPCHTFYHANVLGTVTSIFLSDCCSHVYCHCSRSSRCIWRHFGEFQTILLIFGACSTAGILMSPKLRSISTITNGLHGDPILMHHAIIE